MQNVFKQNFMLRSIFVLLIPVFCACHSDSNKKDMKSEIHVFRLKPGQDLKQSIVHFVEENDIQAGWISSCVGSLTDYQIRFANRERGDSAHGHFEILGLTGLVSGDGVHLHISVADSSGKVTGGHLMEGCLVYTTAEIVIESTSAYRFSREKDGTTPYKELQVIKL